MGKHRLEPPPRVRPRFGRIAAAVASLTVTGVALLGGIGVIPLGAGSAATHDQTPAASGLGPTAAPSSGVPASATPPVTSTTPKVTTQGTPPAAPDSAARTAGGTALPAGSGSGRRVVFSMSDQRVWLVDAQNAVLSTYLVSGSLTDNLHAGSYDVYSRSRWAVGIDDSGVMQYFVRFAHGDNAAIGFHSIPTKNGRPLQSESELGTPQSHGCIRQRLADAERMWNFARTGTGVVVLA